MCKEVQKESKGKSPISKDVVQKGYQVKLPIPKPKGEEVSYTIQTLYPREIDASEIKYTKKFFDKNYYDDDDVKNIAITGSYGSGKSSFIKTVLKDKERKSHLTISLINPTNISDDIKSQNPNDGDNEYLMRKIIEQLLHQINCSWWKIPATNFQTIRSNWRLRISKICIVILSIMLLCRFLKIELNYPKLNLIFAIFALILTFILLYISLGEVHLRYINFAGVNAEVKDKTYFNKNFSEIIYLFENSGYDTIIFDDIDRFRNPYIFYSLREINELINRRRTNKNKKKKFTFIYLIDDELLATEDKTKFFDVIIPIVPKVLVANSYDKIKEILNNYSLGNIFLREISYYIKSYRVLKNICNEFVLYYAQLSGNDLIKQEKLFALIVFKHLFPRDFDNLQRHKGLMYQFITVRKKQIKNGRIYVEETERKDFQTIIKGYNERKSLN